MNHQIPVLLLVAAASVAAQDFARDVEPVLHRKCYGCHGAALQMNGLRLDEKAAALKGGYSGAAIVAGSADKSSLIARVTSAKDGFRMPPAGPKLTDAEVAALRGWIDKGAEWPETAAKKAAPSKKLPWSFEPVKLPAIPAAGEGWARNSIDRFIASNLAAENVKPSPEAAKLTLLRRVSLDLTGLPPKPAEIEAFLKDSSPAAYEHLVDRLLQSPHYGERWARQWLDLARYADSDGYEKDLPRPYAWRWRQWVIEALNADMPFDRFSTLQLAGDLMPNAGPEELVATGFHRNTLRNREGGVKLEQTFFEETVERVNTVSTVWMGLTTGCAQCHDHKYDPISQKDYYSLYAFFDNIDQVYVDAPMPGEMTPYQAKRAEYVAKRQGLLDEHGIPAVMRPWEEKVRWAAKNVGKEPDWDLTYDVIFQMSDGGHKFIWIDEAKRTYRQQEILVNYFIDWYNLVVPKATLDKLNLKELKKKLRALKESYPQLSQAAVITDLADPQPSHLRVRGDYARLGIEVQPAGLGVLKPVKDNGRATRLDLARWLTSSDHPLTARVAVNRMWQEFFGRGLVRTSEDFGRQGEVPTHPELLDWLASDFTANGWKIKRMHKAIVMSATYRQQSNARPELADRDPENAWLARQNRLRLPAEAIRDSALRAAGLLSESIGGKSVYPPQPAGVMELTYAWDTDRWKESTGAEKYRRGLYTFFQRTAPYPQMMNFDAPDSNVAASRRRRSNTPLQALNLLNDPVFHEAAEALTARVLKEGGADAQSRIDRAFVFAFSRHPDERERQILTDTLARHRAVLDKEGKLTDQASWLGVTRTLLNADEFVTRE